MLLATVIDPVVAALLLGVLVAFAVAVSLWGKLAFVGRVGPRWGVEARVPWLAFVTVIEVVGLCVIAWSVRLAKAGSPGSIAAAIVAGLVIVGLDSTGLRTIGSECWPAKAWTRLRAATAMLLVQAVAVGLAMSTCAASCWLLYD